MTYFFKLVLLAGVLAALQVGIYEMSGGDQNQDSFLMHWHELSRATMDIVVFGDSVTDWARDAQRPSIINGLKQVFKPAVVSDLSHAAYRADMDLAMYRNLLNHGSHPRLMIIQVNLHGFSAEWNESPEFQFKTEKAELSYDSYMFRVFFHTLSIWHAFDLAPAKRDTYDQLEMDTPYEDLGKLGDLVKAVPKRGSPSLALIRKFCILRYMYDLDPHDPQLLALQELVRLAEKDHCQVLLYISPVDVEAGTRYVGPSFATAVQHNVLIVKDAVHPEINPIIDLSLSSPHQDFDWSVFPNGHLASGGRGRVIDAIVAEQQKYLLQTSPILSTIRKGN